jgi:hypothetical protein
MTFVLSRHQYSVPVTSSRWSLSVSSSPSCKDPRGSGMLPFERTRQALDLAAEVEAPNEPLEDGPVAFELFARPLNDCFLPAVMPAS